MKAVVTGGLGFLGSHLVHRLLDEDFDVLVIDDVSNDADWSSLVSGARIWRRSIFDVDGPPADVIFHLASPVGPVGVLHVAGQIASQIVNGAALVADWAMQSGAVLVDVSTSEVYGPRPDAVCREAEDCIFGPDTSARKEYTVGKLAAETMLRNRPGLDVRIVRPFNIAGPRQSEWGGFVVPTFIRQALAGEPLTVHQPGHQRRAFTHVSDVVEGMLLAVSRGHRGGFWNLGNPANVTTMLQLAHEVIELTGSSSHPVIMDPASIHEGYAPAAEKIPDITKAGTELAWWPRIGRRQILQECIGWSRSELAAAG